MKTFVLLGALNAFVAIACGAFGAHALAERLTPRLLDVWRTSAQYHLAHALALILVALLCERSTGTSSTRLVNATGWLFVAGIVVFCGSLYLLAVTDRAWLGAITPLGGLCFLSGWALVALAAVRGK